MNCPDSFTELLPQPAREAPRDGRQRALHNVLRSATSHQLADNGKPHHRAVQTGKCLHDSSLCCVLVLVFPAVCAKFFAVSGEAAGPGRWAENELIPAQLQLFRRFVSPPCLHQAEPSTARGRNCWIWVPHCDTST